MFLHLLIQKKNTNNAGVMNSKSYQNKNFNLKEGKTGLKSQ